MQVKRVRCIDAVNMRGRTWRNLVRCATELGISVEWGIALPGYETEMVRPEGFEPPTY
jgi:hypothetical protein